MCPAVDAFKENDPYKRTAGYYFRLGSIPLLFFVLILILALFIMTGTFAPAGEEGALSSYRDFALWYIILGVLSVGLLGWASAIGRARGGITAAGDIFYIEDPHKSWKDFAAIGMCTFGGLGLFVVLGAFSQAQAIRIPEPVLQFVVAGTEEFTFRFVFPVFFFLVLSGLHPNRDVVFLMAILLSGGAFSIFHLFAYSWSPEVFSEMDLIMPLIVAGVAGLWSSVLYYIAVRIGAGGEWALLGLVIGHYGWNLMKLGVNPDVILVYMLVFYVIIAFFMLLLGYFDDLIKPTSHAKARNLKRNRLGGGRIYQPKSKKNISTKLNKKWNKR